MQPPGIQVTLSTPFTIDSRDATPAHWAMLADAVDDAHADPDVDAVVVTHGTDTLEESAFFCHAVLDPLYPTVFTAAMRPADALSADGPANLRNALVLAASPLTRGRGVLMTFGDHVWPASRAIKRHAWATDAFGASIGGSAGSVHHDAVQYFEPPGPPFGAGHARAPWLARSEGKFPAPMVETLAVDAGTPPAMLGAAIGIGCRGLILALPGNGGLPEAWRAAVREACRRGIRIVRASRCCDGGVNPPDEPDLPPHAGQLPPSKARVALMLALAFEDDRLFTRLSQP